MSANPSLNRAATILNKESRQSRSHPDLEPSRAIETYFCECRELTPFMPPDKHQVIAENIERDSVGARARDGFLQTTFSHRRVIVLSVLSAVCQGRKMSQTARIFRDPNATHHDTRCRSQITLRRAKNMRNLRLRSRTWSVFRLGYSFNFSLEYYPDHLHPYFPLVQCRISSPVLWHLTLSFQRTIPYLIWPHCALASIAF